MLARRGPSLAMMASARASVSPVLTVAAAPACTCRVVLWGRKERNVKKKVKGSNLHSQKYNLYDKIAM